MMRRREFITLLGGSVAAWPLAARAQQTGKVPRVGVLSPGNPPPADAFLQRERFEVRLNELGWRPGANIVIEYRYAEGEQRRLPALAASLVRIPVDVIVARGQTIEAARQATATIPIVMAAHGGDPVRSGLVASLAHPGGNITGLNTLSLDSEPKQLELLYKTLPSLKRVAVMTNANSPDAEQAQRTAAAAKALRLELEEFPISRSEQLARVFEMMAEAGTPAAVFRQTLWFLGPNLVHRIPTIAHLREFAVAGVFMSYGISIAQIHRRAADFVDKILKGVNPADLPIEQPTNFEFIINLKTAKTLDIDVPPTLLALADDVIE